MNLNVLVLAAVCLALLALGERAHAASETFTISVPAQTTDFTADTTLSQFNPALGTLTSATLTLATSGTFGGSLKNTSAIAESFSVTENVQIGLTSSNNAITGLSGLQQTLTAGQTYTALGSGASALFGPYTPSSSEGPISFSNLTPFVGTGTLPFTLATMTSTSLVGGGGNIMNAVTTTVGATETITYTYTPTVDTTAVPEPAGLVLGLTSIAAGGLTWIARRRNKKDRN
jgi:hypothetical protein